MKPQVPLWLAALILVAFVCLTATYLATPLPPSKVALVPEVALVIEPAWHSDGTNIHFRVGLTNFGRAGVKFSEQMWEAIAETPSGWKITRAPFASVTGGQIAPGEATTFTVHVPIDTKQWQIAARYHYYRRPENFRRLKVRHNVRALLDKTGFWELAPEFASSAANRWLRSLEPEPDEAAEGVFKTEFFTNLPPVRPWPPK